MDQREPDFFIVGAPKCGTTAMNDYLGRHPRIFMPARKDITYFGSDLRFAHPRVTREEYRSIFRGVADDVLRVGETSVWYMYSKTAAEEIESFAPSARIIAMLRNPVDMLYSQHRQFLYNCNEDIEDFEAALAAEAVRKRGEMIPSRAHFVAGLFYRDTIRYAEQVERYFAVFGRNNVHVIIYDDFRSDTALVYEQTLDFLGVDPSFRPEFEVINANKTVRSRRLQEMIVSPPPVLVRRFEQVSPVWLQGRLMRRLKRANTQRTSRPELDRALRRRLQAEFQPEVQRLADLLGRDLSSWIGS